jgi:hypothetical protein
MITIRIRIRKGHVTTRSIAVAAVYDRRIFYQNVNITTLTGRREARFAEPSTYDVWGYHPDAEA